MRQHSCEFHDLHSLPNIMTVIKSWREDGVRHVTCKEENGSD
jgi:hypothetical protein